MVDKLHEYEGTVGQLHRVRDNIKENFATWKETHGGLDKKIVDGILNKNRQPQEDNSDEVGFDFSYIQRKKTRWELMRLCVVVMGIEYAYSAITAFSSPILLEIGVDQNVASMVFALSPILGFFLSPVTGSMSDRCMFRYGRRRIFMIAHTFFEVIGLLLIPYGINSNINSNGIINVTSEIGNYTFTTEASSEEVVTMQTPTVSKTIYVVTIIGIVLADYNADGLQNPSRAYLLDVCPEEDHTRGLSMFTVLAGLGGTVGYFLGSVDWNNFLLGSLLGGNTKTVFYLTAIIFLLCVLLTITTFPEVPLSILYKIQVNSLQQDDNISVKDMGGTSAQAFELHEKKLDVENGSPDEVSSELLGKRSSNLPGRSQQCRKSTIISLGADKEQIPTLREYLSSIIKLPYSLKILLLTNVLCWMSHVSYSLYFSDYVGEEIFGGSPRAAVATPLRLKYEEGIRFACLGMMVYSLSCLMCSLVLEKAIEKFGLRPVYIANLLIDSLSMLCMFYFNSKVAVVVFSFASGVIYCTLFTVPYIIVARYHTLKVFEVDRTGNYIVSKQVRGLGTDVSIIGSSVFIAQFFLALGIGSLVKLYGSTAAVPLTCSVLSFLAAITATQVVYLDL